MRDLILRQQALLKGELRDFAGGARGTLHLYANTAALAEFLPSRLAPWLAERPRLHVELKERTSAEIVRAVAAGLAEAGIVSNAVEPGNVKLLPVAKDHLVLIVPKEHRLAQFRQVHLADVLNEPFVGLTPENALQDHLDYHARAAGHPFALRIRMKTFEGLCEMVAHGVGLGILPQSIAGSLRRKHSYRTVALTDNWARRQLCLCFRDWDGLSPPMQSLFIHLSGSLDATSKSLCSDRETSPSRSPCSNHLRT